MGMWEQPPKVHRQSCRRRQRLRVRRWDRFAVAIAIMLAMLFGLPQIFWTGAESRRSLVGGWRDGWITAATAQSPQSPPVQRLLSAEADEPTAQRHDGATGDGEAPKERLTRVVVRRGDTLWELAKRYGRPDLDPRWVVERIRQANGLTSPVVYPGQTLIIPVE